MPFGNIFPAFATKAVAATLYHHLFRFPDQSDSCDPVALVTSTFPTKSVDATDSREAVAETGSREVVNDNT